VTYLFLFSGSPPRGIVVFLTPKANPRGGGVTMFDFAGGKGLWQLRYVVQKKPKLCFHSSFILAVDHQFKLRGP